MKKFLNLIIAVILLTSCQAQKETIELNLNKGETYYNKTVANVSINQTFNGQEVKMDMSMTGKMSYKVVDIVNSIYDIEVKYESLSMIMKLPTGNMEFSSEKNDPNDIVSSMLGHLKDNSFFIKMTKKGKILEVKDIEKLFMGMFENYPQLTDDQKMQIKNQIEQSYGEKTFKGNFEMSLAIFPDSAVAIGEKWTINTQLESGFSANMESTYELKEIKDDYYIITGISKIVTADKDAYIKSNGMDMRYDMTGTMNSDIKIYKKSGWTINSKINQNFSGKIHIKDNPKMPGGMTVPMTMESIMTITEK